MITADDLRKKYPDDAPFTNIKPIRKQYFGKSISSKRRRIRISKLQSLARMNEIGLKEFSQVPLSDETLREYKINDDAMKENNCNC